MSRISLSEIKMAFGRANKKSMSKKKSSSNLHKSSEGRGLWKGPLPSNSIQNAICIFLLIMIGTSVSYVLANPALGALTWMNWLPELCSQSSVEWMTRKAASQITGVFNMSRGSSAIPQSTHSYFCFSCWCWYNTGIIASSLFVGE